MTTTDTPRSHRSSEAQAGRVAEGPTPDVPAGQARLDTQWNSAGRDGPDTAPAGHAPGGTHRATASGGGPKLRNGHHSRDAQSMAAVAEPLPRPAIGRPAPKQLVPGGDLSSGDQRLLDAQRGLVAAPTPPTPATVCSAPNDSSLVLADPFLALAADVLDDLETVRVANENRLRQLTRDTTDSDGLERGFGLTLDHPDVARLAALVDGLGKAEHQAELNLAKLLRQHPLGPWVKAQRGVGAKQGARLLAAVGDPYWNDLYGRPRTVSELWAYCGYHVLPAGQNTPDTQTGHASGAPTPVSQAWNDAQSGTAGGSTSPPDQMSLDDQCRPVGGSQTAATSHPPSDAHTPFAGGGVNVAPCRVRGQRANWSADAKKRAWLVAVSCMKSTGPYRDVYDKGRAKYADSTHQVDCKRCGPAGKPALVGSPLSAGHQHARALRLVAKAVLRDLWREAKRLHDAAAVGVAA